MQPVYRLLIISFILLNLEQTIQTKPTEIIEEIMLINAPQENGKIKLFVYNSCPFCHKVINHLKKIGHIEKVVILDAAIPENLDELKRLNNGETQCPFLVDEPKSLQMLESADIIKYLSARLN